MAAIATRGYVLAQLRAAEAAERRLTAHAIMRFGAEKGTQVIEHLKRHGFERHRAHNPDPDQT